MIQDGVGLSVGLAEGGINAEFASVESFTQEGVGFSEEVGLVVGGQFFLTGVALVLF